MRYHDRPTTEAERHLPFDSTLVWDVMVDITFPTRFSSELHTVTWTSGDCVAEGNTFEGHNRNDATFGEWKTECTIIEVDPGRRWVWNVGIAGTHFTTWGFEVDPTSTGCVARQWVRLGPDPSGINFLIAQMPDKESRIISKRLKDLNASMAANLEGIENLLNS